MPSCRTSRRLKAYTLLEVLVVLVLMGLLAASLIPALATTSNNARSDQLINDLIQIDFRARQLAQTGSGCRLQWDESQRSVQLIAGREASEPLQQVELPDEVNIDIDWKQRVIPLNSFGQTPEYGYRLTSERWSARLAFNGLSGWYEVIPDAE